MAFLRIGKPYEYSAVIRLARAPLALVVTVALSALTALSGAAAADFQAADLVGEWSGKAKDETAITYRFQKDGTVIWLVEETGFKQAFPTGLKAKFTLREKEPLWEIDIHDFEDARFKNVTFQGILQPLEKGQFKMEGLPSNRGPRPAKFGDEAIVFGKGG